MKDTTCAKADDLLASIFAGDGVQKPPALPDVTEADESVSSQKAGKRLVPRTVAATVCLMRVTSDDGGFPEDVFILYYIAATNENTYDMTSISEVLSAYIRKTIRTDQQNASGLFTSILSTFVNEKHSRDHRILPFYVITFIFEYLITAPVTFEDAAMQIVNGDVWGDLISHLQMDIQHNKILTMLANFMVIIRIDAETRKQNRVLSSNALKTIMTFYLKQYDANNTNLLLAELPSATRKRKRDEKEEEEDDSEDDSDEEEEEYDDHDESSVEIAAFSPTGLTP